MLENYYFLGIGATAVFHSAPFLRFHFFDTIDMHSHIPTLNHLSIKKHQKKYHRPDLFLRTHKDYLVHPK